MFQVRSSGRPRSGEEGQGLFRMSFGKVLESEMFSDDHVSFSTESNHTVKPIGPKGINHVLSETEWDQLRLIESQTLAWNLVLTPVIGLEIILYLVKQTVEINMQNATRPFFKQYIFTMPVS